MREPRGSRLERLTAALDVALYDYHRETDEGGEVSPELRERVAGLVASTEDEVDAMAGRIMKLKAWADDCYDEAKRLKARGDRWTKAREWLESVVLFVMRGGEWKKVEGVRCTMTRISGRERVVVDDIALVPHEFKKASFTVHAAPADAARLREWVELSMTSQGFAGSVGEVVESVDKRALKEALDVGDVPGASVEVGPDSLRTYIAKAKDDHEAGEGEPAE